ncbi:uncharacterized protein [Rutidosis leptorrhynchoides]|uniref:uncharacterized protein n=1 Tax=Rutidosis leptorrhynchoides TaxID=125765 RepID=UPI003A98DDF4
MFSSNPFSDIPSSPNFFFDYEKDFVSFNNSNPFFSGECFLNPEDCLISPVPVMDNINTFKQDFVVEQEQKFFSEEPWLQSSEDHDDLLESVVSCSKSKKKPETSRKDGHSKIYTARGPRDRRVRLSIDISRKFFCLQDLLGFDKASETLDWLFTKSKNAIKELVEDSDRCSSSSVSDQSRASFLEVIKEGLDEDKEEQKKSVVDGKKKKMARKSTAGFQDNVTRDQARAMARARARERTREKMNIKKLDDELNNTLAVPEDFNFQEYSKQNEDNLVRNAEDHNPILTGKSQSVCCGGGGLADALIEVLVSFFRELIETLVWAHERTPLANLIRWRDKPVAPNSQHLQPSRIGQLIWGIPKENIGQ